MTVAFARHGGVHEWDLTVPQVQELSFVRTLKALFSDQFKANSSYHPVVQYHISRVLSDHLIHQACSATALSTGLFATTLGPVRLGSSIPHGHHNLVLCYYHLCQGLGVYPQGSYLGQIYPRHMP